MEEKLKDAFDRVTMPESCAKRIKEVLCKPTRKGYYAEPVRLEKDGWVKGIAAAAVLVCLVTVGMLLRPDSALSAVDPPEETESTVDERSEILDRNGDVLVDIQDNNGEYERVREDTIREEALDFDHYFTVDEEGRVFTRSEDVATADAASAPQWISDEGGRLYFTGNGEKLDITDEISLEKPFIYIYTDSDNVRWALVAGRTTTGPYVDIGNSVGWFTFCWDEGMNHWNRDGGTHWSNWMHCEWPWLTQAQETLQCEEELEDIRDTHPDNHHDDHCH